MENMQHAEELVREFLVFRGFANTLQAYDTELSTDIGSSFQADKIFNLIFSIYIPKFQAEKLVGLIQFFKQCFVTSETLLFATISKLEVSIMRYYIIHAIQSGRKDKVLDFFNANGDCLLFRGQDWSPWFSIPYVKYPSLDPHFRLYFSKEWSDTLHLSVRNFLSELFNGTRIPEILRISSEKNTVNHLKKDIKQLNLKLSQLQALLEDKEAQIRSSRSISETEKSGDSASASGERSSNFTASSSSHHSSSSGESPIKCAGIVETFQDGRSLENGGEIVGNEEFSEVKVDFQETFLGHSNPISRSRFSVSGNNVASASVDGTVRIWTYDSSISDSRNATICCGSEIMSLDWECKSDRLLLIGTADAGIKAWNVDAKRVVCDLSTSESFPSVMDLKCSPVEPIFVSAAASRGHSSSYYDNLGFASLKVWNMKTWKAVSVLPLGEDPPAITSLCFNHNGKILAASAIDGMIHMFDMSAGLQITGWPAHDSAISSVLFGPDETSIYSLGSDGMIFEWSMQNQGQIIWSRNWSRFCSQESEKNWRHEMAVDATGRKILTTSCSVRSPIYQVRGVMNGVRTLPHSAPVTSVDWHPTLPIFLTGSADHSVRVTSIL